MQKCSNVNIFTVVEDYYQILEGKITENDCYREVIKSIKLKNYNFKFEFESQSFCIDLFNIVKNIIPLYFGTYCENILLQRLDQIFNNEEVLEILSYDAFDSQNFYEHVTNESLLAPLGIKLCRKLKFSDEKKGNLEIQRNLERNCTEILIVEPEFKIEFLDTLFTDKTKNRHLDLARECLEILSGIDFDYNVECKLQYIFSKKEIQENLKQHVSSPAFHKDSPYLKVVKYFVKFRYNSAFEFCKQKNCEKALNHITEYLYLLDRTKFIISANLYFYKIFLVAQIFFKIGNTESLGSEKNSFYKNALEHLNSIKHLPEKKLRAINKKNSYKMFYLYYIEGLIAQIYFEKGENETNINSRRSFYQSSLNNLNNILTFNIENNVWSNGNEYVWKLGIDNFRAKINNKLTKYEEAYKIYKNIILQLLNIKKGEYFFRDFKVSYFKDVLDSQKYKSVIKFDENLNILKLLNIMYTNLYHYGKSITNNPKHKNRIFSVVIEGFLRSHIIQKSILKLNSNITRYSLFKVGEITLKLNLRNYRQVYKRSGAIFLLANKGILRENIWTNEQRKILNSYLLMISYMFRVAGDVNREFSATCLNHFDGYKPELY